MTRRVALLLVTFVSLSVLDPAWAVLDWSDPVGWLREARTEDAVAAGLRSLAMVVAGSQLAALGLLGVGHLTGNGATQRLATRVLLPVVTRAAPLALIAGTALPAAASEARIPIAPPVAEHRVDLSTTPSPMIVVASGDSMWTIAADHATGDVGAYWHRVVELNRHRFEDVNLIHPGDFVLLPPVNPTG
ncbi:MAG TPA: hypothetical protein VMS74_09445 [Acidimicrobiia bacterium]|nr:hypothetical protein [Acidimicrobiia bacterium]